MQQCYMPCGRRNNNSPGTPAKQRRAAVPRHQEQYRRLPPCRDSDRAPAGAPLYLGGHRNQQLRPRRGSLRLLRDLPKAGGSRMTQGDRENNKNISTTEYVVTNFQRSDRLAVLVRNRSRGETVQRITSPAKIVESSFQDWLRHKNEKESCDSISGEHPETRSPYPHQGRHPNHPSSLYGHRPRWPGGSGQDSTVESRTSPELHGQHIAG
jgi:hypothetical protein